MTTPVDPSPSERTRVERLLARLIQGHDAELERLDRIRQSIDWAPLRMGCVLISIEAAAWALRLLSAR